MMSEEFVMVAFESQDAATLRDGLGAVRGARRTRSIRTFRIKEAMCPLGRMGGGGLVEGRALL